MNIFEKIAGAAERERLAVLVIGGHAVNAYGYTRTTLDVDFLVAVESFPEWRSSKRPAAAGPARPKPLRGWIRRSLIHPRCRLM